MATADLAELRSLTKSAALTITQLIPVVYEVQLESGVTVMVVLYLVYATPSNQCCQTNVLPEQRSQADMHDGYQWSVVTRNKGKWLLQTAALQMSAAKAARVLYCILYDGTGLWVAASQDPSHKFRLTAALSRRSRTGTCTVQQMKQGAM
ncbi:TPA: hypothetical protein ACH3X2_002637 [Trebouxia sp. C0005]